MPKLALFVTQYLSLVGPAMSCRGQTDHPNVLHNTGRFGGSFKEEKENKRERKYTGHMLMILHLKKN